MSRRPLVRAVVALLVAAALVPGACAQQKAAKAKAGSSPIFLPQNIKRSVVTFQQVSGMLVTVKTAGGAPLTLLALNPNLLLLKDLRVAKPKEFKAGDKLIVYYNVPSNPSDSKVLWVVTDPRSEIILAELRAKPVAATFKSFDPASNKLTVQTAKGVKTYPVTTPVMAVREMKEAKLGVPSTKDEMGYVAGDKLLLVLTADGKRVRLIEDQTTYERYAAGLKKFPVPAGLKVSSS